MLRTNCITCTVFCLVLCVNGNSQNVSKDNIEDILPRPYNLDNFEDCKNIDNNFCEIRYSLKSKYDNNTIWIYISESLKDFNKYRKDRIYRGVCIPKNSDEMTYLREKINREELEKVSLEAMNIDILSCRKTYEIMPSDYRFATFLAFYIALIAYGTLYDLKLRKTKANGNNFILAFSLVANFEKICKPKSNKLYNKLKAAQGIRTYSMVLVVTGHSLMSYLVSYTANPQFLENVIEHNAVFFNWGMYLVQPFFFLSGMMLMLAMNTIVEREKKLTITFVFKIILLRCTRIWPTLIFITLIHMSSFPNYLFQGAHTYSLQVDHMACKQYWWATWLFLTNNLKRTNVCNIATWYLSADVQNYVLSVMAFYIIYKLKLPLIRSFLAILSASLVLQMAIMCYYKSDVIYRVSPDNFVMYNLLHEFWPSFIWYTSTLSNNPSFIIGILFGILLLKYDGHVFFSYKAVRILWYFAFFGIPLLACILSIYRYSRIVNAVLGASLKPLYTLGIGIGILGMTQGYGGIIKGICEWRPAEILAQTTFSVYLSHVAIAFSLTFMSTSLITVTIPKMVATTVVNVIICFIFGFSVCHMVELPWINIEKLILNSLKSKKVD